MGNSSSSEAQLPPALAGLSSPQLCELGKKENWAKLEDLILPLCSGKFWVTSPARDTQLAVIRTNFDGSRDPDEVGILHTLMRTQGDEENADLLKKLLSLGLDPDVEDCRNRDRPSHLCAWYGSLESAMALVACRPNLEAKNARGKTPIEEAAEIRVSLNLGTDNERELRRANIAKLWMDIKGFPSISELASHEKWWAVQNLSRRRLVPLEEAFSKHNGRDVVEWAFHHNQQDLAQELLYLLRESCAGVANRVASKFNQFKTSVDQIEGHLLKTREGLQEQIDTAREDVAREVDGLKSALAAERQALAALEGKFDTAQATIAALSARIETLEAKSTDSSPRQHTRHFRRSPPAGIDGKSIGSH